MMDGLQQGSTKAVRAWNPTVRPPSASFLA
jgi:hypothetical protein